MKIKNTEIKIIQGDIANITVDIVADCSSLEENLSERDLRQRVDNVLKKARQLKLKSLVWPAMGCGRGGFSTIGSAKIMAQSVLKFLRNNETPLKEITFCLNDPETFKIFEYNVLDYLKHVTKTLGPGPYITVDIIIELEEGIVAIERSNPPYGWALPGGFLDYGESLEAGAVREAKEETNLDIVNLKQLKTYSDPERDPRFHTISTVFIAQGQGTPQSGDDAKNLKIIKYADLEKIELAFDHNQVVRDYLARRKGND